jgi:hypothetical protein
MEIEILGMRFDPVLTLSSKMATTKLFKPITNSP